MRAAAVEKVGMFCQQLLQGRHIAAAGNRQILGRQLFFPVTGRKIKSTLPTLCGDTPQGLKPRGFSVDAASVEA